MLFSMGSVMSGVLAESAEPAAAFEHDQDFNVQHTVVAGLGPGRDRDVRDAAKGSEENTYGQGYSVQWEAEECIWSEKVWETRNTSLEKMISSTFLPSGQGKDGQFDICCTVCSLTACLHFHLLLSSVQGCFPRNTVWCWCSILAEHVQPQEEHTAQCKSWGLEVLGQLW